jgi:hypothetical protein
MVAYCQSRRLSLWLQAGHSLSVDIQQLVASFFGSIATEISLVVQIFGDKRGDCCRNMGTLLDWLEQFFLQAHDLVVSHDESIE